VRTYDQETGTGVRSIAFSPTGRLFGYGRTDATVVVAHNPFACPADINGDGRTDLADLGILLADFGCTPPATCPGDIDNDGDTDLADLGILLADFGCGT
jgi:hypothetical protein